MRVVANGPSNAAMLAHTRGVSNPLQEQTRLGTLIQSASSQSTDPLGGHRVPKTEIGVAVLVTTAWTRL